MIELVNIKKSYHQRHIVDVDHFRFDDSMTWLFGSNGSGKTTLLKIISGMIPFDGDVISEGISLKQNPLNHRRLISYAAAEPLYPSSLSGNDLLRFITTARQAKREEENAVTGLLGMTDYLDQKVGSYSSGMTKKLSIAMAFIGSTKWILLDEPLITLDQEAQEVLFHLIQDRMKNGTQFIFTSHQIPASGSFHPLRKVIIHNAKLTYAD